MSGTITIIPIPLQSSIPYTAQVCTSYTPTYPNVPVPPTAPYRYEIKATAILYFAPGIYWERCVNAYFFGGGFWGGGTGPVPPGGATVSGYDSTEGTTTYIPTLNVTITLLGA